MQQSPLVLQALREDIFSSIAAKPLRRTGRFVPVENASNCSTVSALAVCLLFGVVTAELILYLVYLCETRVESTSESLQSVKAPDGGSYTW